MDESAPPNSEWYYYCSSTPSRDHRFSRNAYLSTPLEN